MKHHVCPFQNTVHHIQSQHCRNSTAMKFAQASWLLILCGVLTVCNLKNVAAGSKQVKDLTQTNSPKMWSGSTIIDCSYSWLLFGSRQQLAIPFLIIKNEITAQQVMSAAIPWWLITVDEKQKPGMKQSTAMSQTELISQDKMSKSSTTHNNIKF